MHACVGGRVQAKGRGKAIFRPPDPDRLRSSRGNCMSFNLLDLLLPRETKFFGMLEQMSTLLVTSTRAFLDLVVQIELLTEDEIAKRLLIIKDCEQQGDRLEVQILDELDRTFITPIDR